MLSIQISGKVPIYEEIANKIEEMVLTDVLDADVQLPSVREFANDLAVNPNTIQKAYQELEIRGITYSVYGKGNFVTHDVGMIKQKKLENLFAQIWQKIKQYKQTGGEEEKLSQLVLQVFHEKGEDV